MPHCALPGSARVKPLRTPAGAVRTTRTPSLGGTPTRSLMLGPQPGAIEYGGVGSWISIALGPAFSVVFCTFGSSMDHVQQRKLCVSLASTAFTKLLSHSRPFRFACSPYGRAVECRYVCVLSGWNSRAVLPFFRSRW